MSLDVFFTPSAKLDLREARDHYRGQNEELAEGFVECAQFADTNTITSVLVDDQEKALSFYTDILGFQNKHDIPMGLHRWLTVVSKTDPNGVKLLLEPDEHPTAKPFPCIPCLPW